MGWRVHEAKTHVRATMAKHGWKHLRSTPLGKPVRFVKEGPDGKEYSIKSTNGNLYKLEVWDGRYLPVHYGAGAYVKIYHEVAFVRYESPLALALWFDRVGVTLLRLCK